MRRKQSSRVSACGCHPDAAFEALEATEGATAVKASMRNAHNEVSSASDWGARVDGTKALPLTRTSSPSGMTSAAVESSTSLVARAYR